MNVCFSDRSRKFVALAAGSVLLGSLLSCATTDRTSGGEPGELAVLSAVEIEWEGDATVVGLVSEGKTEAQILADYPDLETEDIREALAYAAEAVRERQLPIQAG